jgi:hypothetical protein
MKISALIAENVRNFEGEHVIDLDEGLNVFIGKNNTGKSTLLRIPTLLGATFVNSIRHPEMGRRRSAQMLLGVRFQCSSERFDQLMPGSRTELFQMNLFGAPSVGGGWTDRGTCVFDAIGSDLGGGFRLPPSTGLAPHIHELRWIAGSYQLSRSDGATETLSGNPTPMLAFLTSELGERFLPWAHRPFQYADFRQHQKRLLSAEDAKVQETLTFLKMKHYEEHFVALASAITRALPEFKRLDFDDAYKPAFKLGDTNQLLTRDLVGSGSWTFLSILTAAHAAVATGAETIVLDEPHLYLHPGLERRLVNELMRDETWGEQAPQLLVATHSPVFLDAAWRKGKVYLLDWEDENRTKVKAHELTRGEIQNQLRNAVSVSTISDLLYADRIVFVEGASDVKTLEVLTESITSDGANIRFEPLKSPDNIRQQAFVNALRAVSRGFSTVPGVKPVLLLDADKRVEIEAVWRDMESSPRTGFEVYWAGATGHDMESIFADAPFLAAFFAAKGITDAGLLQTCAGAVAPIFDENLPPPTKDETASQRLFALHERWFPGVLPSPEQGGKTVLLEALATFYRSDTWTEPLPMVENLIKTLKGVPPTTPTQ